MLKFNCFISLVFLYMMQVGVLSSLETPTFPSLHSLKMIESVMRSSFENVSRTTFYDGMSSRSDGEPMRSLNHGYRAPNTHSSKLSCVWKAMSDAARHLPQITSEAGETDNLMEQEHIRQLCRSLSRSSCGANLNSRMTCDSSYEYRSIDGTCNNLQNTEWGSAPTPFERYLEADYGDGIESFRESSSGQELPNPRTISRSLSRVYSTSVKRPTPKVSLMVMQWGQFIDHDITLTPEREVEECCEDGVLAHSESLGEDCTPIDVNGDSWYKQDNIECIEFRRSLPATTGCSFCAMEQINENTAFVDGSMVYGSTEEVADLVRTKIQGLLATTEPDNTDQNLPPKGTPAACPALSDSNCYQAGDVRVDEQPALTAIHSAFINLHNIIADTLRTNYNPQWNDEKLFQESRRIVSALIQQITYRDWLPLVLGPTNMRKYDLNTETRGYKDTYNPSVNPSIRNAFATAAFRFGHTLVSDMVKASTDQDNVALEGHFFNISVIQSDATSPSSLLKGLSRCPSEPVDGFVVETLTNKLFAPHSNDGTFFGLDLVSLNIQRGRDHGIPSYKEWMMFCDPKKGKKMKKFKHMKKSLDKSIAKEFERIYRNINDVDLFPAGLSEMPISDGLLGPTFTCILAKQFAEIKHGDRFWYEREDQPKPFTPAQLSSIRSQSLASILCKVSENTAFSFQQDPFLVADSKTNPLKDCSNFKFINLQPWDEDATSTDSPATEDPADLIRLPCQCGEVTKSQSNSNSIYNHPWTVALLDNSNAAFCSGTIINTYYILTAKNCISGKGTSFKIRLNEQKLGTGTPRAITRNAKSVVTNGDLALVKMDTAISLTAYDAIKPACLPNSNKDFVGDSATHSGYDHGEVKKNSGSWTSQSGSRLTFKPSRRGNSYCREDLGGPIVSVSGGKQYLAGIALDQSCSSRSQSSAKVSNYYQWIMDNSNTGRFCQQ